MNLALSFAEALKQRRKALDLTQQELAHQVGCAAVTIQRIEQGTLRPSRQIVQRLTAILDIPANERERFACLARGVPLPNASEEQPNAPAGARSSRSLLPIPLTSLIGRVQEVAAVGATLATTAVRLLTLIGPGGVGKTRLALQVAADLEMAFADGTVFVDLAPISDPDLVVSGIAQSLEIKEAGGQPLIVALQRYLRDKQLLLLLDNFEQVLAAAPLVAELLAAAPQLKVLITSRVVVGVYGEHMFLVPPLTLPDLSDLPPRDQVLQIEAVRLFVERAQAASVDFRLTDANARAVSEICHRLDGLPLAIELAAARVRLLPPQILLQRLSSRLQLLTGGPRTVPARQQTLRATLAWSYDLLDPAEQRLFRRLGVFVGGCTLEAVERVCDLDGDLALDVLDGAASLLDKSLLQRREGADGAARFHMLETIREHALEQLAASGELEMIRLRHAGFLVTFAEGAKPALIGQQQVRWMNRLELEHPNLRAALVWGLATDNNRQLTSDSWQRWELGLRLAVALGQFWSRHGHLSEGRRWLAHALTRTEAEAASGRPTTAYHSQRAEALRRLGTLAVWQNDLAAAQPAYEESLALYRAIGDSKGVADVLGHFGMLFEVRGDHGRAADLLEESLSMFRDLGDARGIAACLFFLGTLAHIQGNSRGADALWEESLMRYRGSGDMYGVAVALNHCGMVALDQGDEVQAGAHLAESLTLQRELGDRWQTALALELCAGVTAAQGRQAGDAQPGGLRAARLFGAAEALRETLGAPILPHNQEYYQRRVAAARAQLAEAIFAAAWAEGRAMTLEQAIAYALEESDPASASSIATAASQ